MRVVFAGTPEFAAAALGALLTTSHRLALVLTQPDRPAGRGMKVTESPVKALARAHRIELVQPTSLKSVDAQAILRHSAPDVMVVAAYGLILPPAVLAIPRFGCVNVHASLLPRWRGAAPIQRALLEGDRETGISIMQMDSGVDTGPILLQEKMAIARDETAQSLHDKLAILGGKLIVAALNKLAMGALTLTPQALVGITYAAKIKKEEAWIAWEQPAVVIERQVRAFNPSPVAHTRLAGTGVRIWRARAEGNANAEPGKILDVQTEHIRVGCGEGSLAIFELQCAGGRRLAAAEFQRGFPIAVGNRLGD